jgi:hypothetical protein
VRNDGEVVVLGLEDLLQPLRPFDLLDVRLDADGGKL